MDTAAEHRGEVYVEILTDTVDYCNGKTNTVTVKPEYNGHHSSTSRGS